MWSCYLIRSLNTNQTYIGSSNNPIKRLETHNKGKGAKRTKGQTWIHVLIISNFPNKNSCLSFESNWKRLCKRRNNSRLTFFNEKYKKDPKINRILDLLYYVYNITYISNKYKLNYNLKNPINFPEELIFEIFSENWIYDLNWPFFITLI